MGCKPSLGSIPGTVLPGASLRNDFILTSQSPGAVVIPLIDGKTKAKGDRNICPGLRVW